ncbi:ROK family transcriptional regulator [Streptomyces sp. NPDC050560]|uniref:ROK family transcriptional regulator n=1 Tax=Streptomyces sp. NPDC050560 TaxID=3365630 RepID=UPI0037875CB4
MAVRGTPSWLGDQNAAMALRLLLDHGPLSRNGLGELSGLSKPTAAQMVARLVEKGLIEAVGETSAGRGPSATLYDVRNDLAYGVAVNVDQEGVRSTLVDLRGTPFPVAERSASGLGGRRSAARDVAGAVLGACESAEVPLADVRQVCVGVPSSVDPRSDELSSVQAMPGWSRKSIRHQLEEALGCAVRVDNDVNLAAVAERGTGAIGAEATFALLWVGYGIGLAVDVAGTVLRGASGGAGEIGNLPVPRGVLGPDVAAVDLEDLLGAAALDRIGRDTGASPHTFEDVLGGAPLPDAVLDVFAPRLAQGVIPVLGVVDPELVVFGGPVGRAGGERLAARTRAAIRDHTRWDPRVETTGVTGDAVLHGARSVLHERLRADVTRRAGAAVSEEDRSRIIRTNLRGIN